MRRSASPEILSSAYERNVELRLVYVVLVVSRGKNFALVDVVDLDSLEYLSFCKMTDSALRHYRYRHCFLNALDHLRVAHSRYASGCADIRRNALQRHDCAGSGGLGDTRLLRGCYVHYYAALQHLGEILIKFKSV